MIDLATASTTRALSLAMLRRGLTALLVSSALCVPVLAQATTDGGTEASIEQADALADLDLVAGIEARTLDNGLRVVAIPDRRAPVVTHMLWVHAGAADEPPGKSGIAHYLEHLLFKGTPNVPMGEYSGLIAANGGQENAFTTQDVTAYFQRIPPDILPTVMAYEADRLVNLVLTDEMILTEREVIREERESRVGQSPGAELGEAANAALFLNHPYGTPVIGWPKEIDSLTAEDASAFYERFYRPDNATLVVAGDVEPNEVFRLAEETYGRIEVEGPSPERVRPSEPGSRVTRTVELADPRVSRPRVSLSWLAPVYGEAEDGEAEAIDLLTEILSGSSTSRLYRQLVVEDRVAAGAGAFYDGSSLDIGRFGLSVTPADGVSVGEAEEAIRAEVARIAEEGVSEDELRRARDRLLVSTVFARDSQASMARIVGGSLARGSTLDDIAAWPEALRAVTPEDVAQAARRFTGEGFVRAILKPKERVAGLTRIVPSITPAAVSPSPDEALVPLDEPVEARPQTERETVR